MPRKLWQVRLCCPDPACAEHPLTSAGLYPRVRQVLDMDGFYHLAAEYLECTKCKKKLISWSGAITRQLDLGHRVQFPVLLTYQSACDLRVAKLMRQRGLGNSASQLRHKLMEQHSEMWSQRVVHYLTDCQSFVDATSRHLLVKPDVRDPPPMAEVPGYKWLQTVYCNDVIQRLDEVKAAITSVFGKVLKLDSTKKVVKKLAGHSAGTASWATNVGNEFSQVLMSVLTASEGRRDHGPLLVCRRGPALSALRGPRLLRPVAAWPVQGLARAGHPAGRVALHAPLLVGLHHGRAPALRPLHESPLRLHLRVEHRGCAAPPRSQVRRAAGAEGPASQQLGRLVPHHTQQAGHPLQTQDARYGGDHPAHPAASQHVRRGAGSRHPGRPAAGLRPHLGHLAVPETARGLHPGPGGLLAVYGDPQAEEGRHAAARVHVRPRIHLAGVIPLTPEPVHPRHQRQRHALPGLSAGGSRALEWRPSVSRDPDGGHAVFIHPTHQTF